MGRAVIKVENISKQYRLGVIGTGTFSHDLNRFWSRLRGKEDPYSKIGEENDRTVKSATGYVWALKDLSFDVQQGDIVGIIGSNGAGKSTLLKILSRTTLPTKGNIMVRGRIASLLEVGTGFHPELTGRENVFLNGAIMGMSRPEIRRKFDEILDFAGVEKYIDTPVKRYSSGMYVRLAFAVAAHLEPEILIVDEVLAVGDAEFQKKALGKMQSVSTGEGRTVLFVSHNVAALRRLCVSGLYLRNGEKVFHGAIDQAIEKYLISKNENMKVIADPRPKGILVKSVTFTDWNDREIQSFCTHESIKVKIRFKGTKPFEKISFAIGFDNMYETRVMSLWSSYIGKSFDIDAGDFQVEFEVRSIKLLPGEYFIHVYMESKGQELVRIDNFTKVSVSFVEKYGIVVEPRTTQGFYLEEFAVNLR